MIQKIQSHLPAKARSKKGFTLAELLIVVAIIAILVAIAIPLFSAQLEKANKATDQANERSAKAAMVGHLVDATITAATTTFYFDADKGDIVPSTSVPTTKYGKSNSATTTPDFTGTPKGKVIQVTVTSGSSGLTVKYAWV